MRYYPHAGRTTPSKDFRHWKVKFTNTRKDQFTNVEDFSLRFRTAPKDSKGAQGQSLYGGSFFSGLIEIQSYQETEMKMDQTVTSSICFGGELSADGSAYSGRTPVWGLILARRVEKLHTYLCLLTLRFFASSIGAMTKESGRVCRIKWSLTLNKLRCEPSTYLLVQ